MKYVILFGVTEHSSLRRKTFAICVLLAFRPKCSYLALKMLHYSSENVSNDAAHRYWNFLLQFLNYMWTVSVNSMFKETLLEDITWVEIW